MKKFLKIIGILLSVTILTVVIFISYQYFKRKKHVDETYAMLGNEAPVLALADGSEFRDLNKNGKLDIYEDRNADIDDRVEDLLNQMTLEEKAGTMFITMTIMSKDGKPVDMPSLSGGQMELMMSLMMPSASDLIIRKNMNSFNILMADKAGMLARFNNNLQKIAGRTRLGIPVTIASDPRHGTQNNIGAAIYTPFFSQWPSALGLAATRDTALVREFGDVARQEYLAVGIRLALHPMADLATEPRWGRINGTFGEDAELAAAMTKAYILGFQGDSLNNQSVACMSKHFSGGGPQKTVKILISHTARNRLIRAIISIIILFLL